MCIEKRPLEDIAGRWSFHLLEDSSPLTALYLSTSYILPKNICSQTVEIRPVEDRSSILPSALSLREPVRMINIQKVQVANVHPGVFIILSFRDS